MTDIPYDAVWRASRTYNEFTRSGASHPDAMRAALSTALPYLGQDAAAASPAYDVAGTSLRLIYDTYKPYDVVGNWHRENHTGRLEGCQEQPCHAVAKLGDK